jgi:hypothetical protein
MLDIGFDCSESAGAGCCTAAFGDRKLRMVISRGGREQRQQQIPALRFAPLGMTIDLNRLTSLADSPNRCCAQVC